MISNFDDLYCMQLSVGVLIIGVEMTNVNVPAVKNIAMVFGRCEVNHCTVYACCKICYFHVFIQYIELLS